ncbi:nitrogen fixation negative regulator NifL [Martelella endophytica]|uniref:nitrogen fixation negative regulator NifL n=1 Tax=Martelella endophytica TaxID=1486262 RepID=UPI0005F21094|nr:nitrogen fixation negative regulator NifL [Martelella endophytica]
MTTPDAKDEYISGSSGLAAILKSLPEDLPPELRRVFELEMQLADGLPPRLYQDAVEQISVAISITDCNADILYVNAAFEALTGYTIEEVRGRNESILSNRRTPKAVYVDLWTTISNGHVWNGRLINRKKDGERYLAEVTIVPVKSQAGEIRYFLGMHRDITEMHHLQRRSENQKNLIENILDSAPVVMALVDTSGAVLFENRTYKALAADMEEGSPIQFFLSELAPLIGEDLISACAEERTLSGIEVCYKPKGSHGSRWFSCSALWVRELEITAESYFESDVKNALLLVCSEITSLKWQYEQVRLNAVRAQMAELALRRGTNEIIEGALYQLQGPLNVMQAMSGMVKRREGEDSHMGMAIDEALSSGNRAIDRLKLSQPPLPQLAPAPINLNQVLRDVLVLSANRLSASGVVVDWRPERELPSIYGHENLLRILMKLLLDNAITAVGEPGAYAREILIATRIEGPSMIEIFVRDRGPGVDKAIRSQIFEPFFSAWSPKRRGAGMGLAIGQQIVSELGGEMMIETAHQPGFGMCVALPTCGALKNGT